MASPVVKTAAGRAEAARTLRWALAVALLLDATACRQGQREPVEKSAYAEDIERICFAEERSGALDQEPGRRSIVVAHWLGRILETEESRALLGRMARMTPAEKAGLLRTEADKLGFERCPMASVWSAGK